MKKAFPLVMAAIVFAAALILLQPAPARTVVVAAYDLRAGHVLAEQDLELMSVPEEVLAPDVLADKTLLLGQPLRIDRGQGDVIRASQLGNLIQVEPNERAIAVRVNDASGVAGLLVPGQRVGVVASIPQEQSLTGGAYNLDGLTPVSLPDRPSFSGRGTFSKAVIEGLRVLFIDPRFAANTEANVLPQSSAEPALAGVTTEERAGEGTVLLAVPVHLQSVFYDFSSSGGISQTRQVQALELLAALSGMDGAAVTLYLMPQSAAESFSSPGLWLPDLILAPQTPPPATATPTVSPTTVP